MKRAHFVISTFASVMSLSGCMVATDEAGDADPSEGSLGELQQPLGGLILNKYLTLNAQNGPLGGVLAPDDEQTTFFNTGRYNLFANGRILWKYGASEAFSSYGGIDGAYGSFGYEWGTFGFPTLDEAGLSGSRRRTKYEFGNLYWKSATGAWPVVLVNAPNKLAVQGWARITTASLPFDGFNGACLTNVQGAGFSPGSTVQFYINTPDNAALISGASTAVAANGTFSYTDPVPCLSAGQIKKINNVATIEGRDTTGRRAAIGVTTSAGGAFLGTL
jgi:uncharacterized protein with LGFP repeats